MEVKTKTMMFVYFLLLGVVCAFPSERGYEEPIGIGGNMTDVKNSLAPDIAVTISPFRQDGGKISKETVKSTIPCGFPDIPRIGNLTYLENDKGVVFAIYHCPIGYFLEGNRIRKCENNRKWSGIQPVCKLLKKLKTTQSGTTSFPTTTPSSKTIPPNNGNAAVSNRKNPPPEGANKISVENGTIILIHKETPDGKPNDTPMEAQTIALIAIAVGVFLIAIIQVGKVCYSKWMKKRTVRRATPDSPEMAGFLTNGPPTHGVSQ